MPFFSPLRRRSARNRPGVVRAAAGGIVLMLSLLLTTIGCDSSSEVACNPVSAGQPLAAFELLPLLDDSVVDRASFENALVSDVPPKVTILHFWGTWCGPCRMEYPELAAMVAQYELDPGFAFYSVSCEYGKSSLSELREETVAFFDTEGISHSVYCDPSGTTRIAAAKLLGNPNMMFPTTLLFDADRKLVAAWEGYSPSGVEQMAAKVDRLLKSDAISHSD